MLRFRRHLRGNAVAYLALFVALGGTSAYATDTIGSDDVIDNSLRSQDISDFDGRDLRTGIARVDMRPNSIGSEQIVFRSIEGDDIAGKAIGTPQLGDGAVTGDVLATDAVTGAKIADGNVGWSELADGAVRSNHILDDTITGADVKFAGLDATDISIETLTTREVKDRSLGLDDLFEIKLRKKTIKHIESDARTVSVHCQPTDAGLAGGAKIKSVDENVGLAASRPIFKDGVMTGWTARATEEDDASPNTTKLTVYITCIGR